MNPVIGGYARLARPANLPTAAADIMAGVAIAGIFTLSDSGSIMATNSWSGIMFLICSSIFLYAGGVVLNDVFDSKIDHIERPERPIPSGLVSVKAASVYGTILLIIGVVFSYLVNTQCTIIALLLVASIVTYDAVAKNHGFFGPIVMGLCRALNLLLGMSILDELLLPWIALIPMVYIFAITLISRGEVHGNNKNHIIWAGILYSIVIFTIVCVLIVQTDNFIQAIPFVILFGYLIYRPLYKAYVSNSPKTIKKAVIAGVLSLIVMDAAIAAGFSNWGYGLMVLALLPISMIFSKVFAVT